MEHIPFKLPKFQNYKRFDDDRINLGSRQKYTIAKKVVVFCFGSLFFASILLNLLYLCPGGKIEDEGKVLVNNIEKVEREALGIFNNGWGKNSKSKIQKLHNFLGIESRTADIKNHFPNRENKSRKLRLLRENKVRKHYANNLAALKSRKGNDDSKKPSEETGSLKLTDKTERQEIFGEKDVAFVGTGSFDLKGSLYDVLEVVEPQAVSEADFNEAMTGCEEQSQELVNKCLQVADSVKCLVDNINILKKKECRDNLCFWISSETGVACIDDDNDDPKLAVAVRKTEQEKTVDSNKEVIEPKISRVDINLIKRYFNLQV